MRLFTGLMLGLLLGCVGCSDSWSATIECELCTGKEEITGLSCSSNLGAQAAAKAECARRNGQFVNLISEDTELIFTTNCPETRQSLPPVLSDLVKWTQSLAAAEPPACPSPKMTFTVVARNDYPGFLDCVNGPRLVRVAYQKYISPGVTELTKLEQPIALGASHTFTVVDCAAKNQLGDSEDFKVLFQAFEVAPGGATCRPIPLDDGAYGRNFGGVMRQGWTLDLTLTEEGDIDQVITQSRTADKDTTSAANSQALVPIPDPMFAAGKR